MLKAHNSMPVELIQESLREAFELYGRPITAREWLDWHGRAATVKTIYRKFKTWEAAWASIGVELYGEPYYGYPHYRRQPPELRSKRWLALAYYGDGDLLTPHSTHQIADHLDRHQMEVLKAMIGFEIPRRTRGEGNSLRHRGLTFGAFPIMDELGGEA